MRVPVVCALLTLGACGPELEESGLPGTVLEQSVAGIVGGTESEADSSVFILDVVREEEGEPQRVVCSAALLGSRSLLTAAHCLVGAKQVRASNAPTWSSEPAAWHAVTELRLHPHYDTEHPTRHDLAFALLAEPATARPLAWNTDGLEGLSGAALRAVGYGTGLTSDETTGVRRSVGLVFTQINPDVLRLGDGESRGICHGDSGGPSLHTFSDGVERLVGVHSFTTVKSCTEGGDVRVDAYAAFVATWLQDKEGIEAAPELLARPEPAPSCQGVLLWPWPGAGLTWLWRRRRRER